MRHSLPENVDTDAARAERHAQAMTQQIIGSMMLRHPGSIWSTASLLSQPITLHPANSPRAGHPTTKNGRDSFGQTVTSHRTPNGLVWFEPGGYPDLLVEFEGDRSRLRIVEHIEAALWQSSVMRRPTTPESQ